MADTEASKAMLRRIVLMARFINEHHMDEFCEYWRATYPGKAEPSETVNYWAHGDPVDILVLGRVT